MEGLENFSHGSLDSTSVIRAVVSVSTRVAAINTTRNTVPRFLAGFIYTRLSDEDSNPRGGSRDKNVEEEPLIAAEFDRNRVKSMLDFPITIDASVASRDVRHSE